MKASSTLHALSLRCLGNFISLLIILVISNATDAGAAEVKLLRTPDGGIQPQAAMDARGAIHLLYYKGDARAGDLFYVRQEPAAESWSKPIRVNSRSGSALAVGTIRGAQISLGRNGRVHVAWNGSSNSVQHAGAPMLYTRLNDAGTAFEAERDLITAAAGLDGGGSVAANTRGEVYVTWHAPIPGASEGEENRAVFIAKSSDDGRTFAQERQATSTRTGACGCCGMRTFADDNGAVFVLYRGATKTVNRDEVLLVSKDGTDFQVALSHPWKIGTCPMSSAAFGQKKEGILAAWETENEIFFATIDPKTLSTTKPISPNNGSKKKHPAVATNSKGETLVVWTEGTAWQKGGALAWQLFDADNRATSTKGREDGVLVWSFAAAVAKPDGTFVVIY